MKHTVYYVNPFTSTFRSIKDVQYNSAKDGSTYFTFRREGMATTPRSALTSLPFLQARKMKQNNFLHTDKPHHNKS